MDKSGEAKTPTLQDLMENKDSRESPRNQVLISRRIYSVTTRLELLCVPF